MKSRKTVQKALACSLICFFLLLSTGLAYGQETRRAATLSNFTGEVSIMKAGGEKAVKAFKQMSLTQGDRIITGRNASAVLKIDEDMTLHVSENTRMLISELIKSSRADSQATSLNLQTGGVWTTLKKPLNVNSKFEIKTPTAVMGARGTQFYTLYTGRTTDVSVLSGAVSISSYTANFRSDGSMEQITLEVVLENNEHITLEAKPSALMDFIVEELTLEKLDLFALEMIQEILETEPELVNPEWGEELEAVIEQKKEEKRQADEAYDELMETLASQRGQPSDNILYEDAPPAAGDTGSGGGGSSSAQTFTVTFPVYGGTPVSSQTVTYNGRAARPDPPPTKEGHIFAGWYTDDTYAMEFDFENTAIVADSTIHAKWLKNAPVLVAAENAAVDNDIVITFNDDAAWRAAITAVKAEGVMLSSGTDYTLSEGKIALAPAGGNPLLTTSGLKLISVEATGCETAQIEQLILPGALKAEDCTVSVSPDPAAGETSTVTIKAVDRYGNPIEGYQFYIEIFTFGEGYEIDGETYDNEQSDYNGPLKEKTDAAGTVAFQIIIPPAEDLEMENGFEILIKSGEEDVIGDFIRFMFIPDIT